MRKLPVVGVLLAVATILFVEGCGFYGGLNTTVVGPPREDGVTWTLEDFEGGGAH